MTVDDCEGGNFFFFFFIVKGAVGEGVLRYPVPKWLLFLY